MAFNVSSSFIITDNFISEVDMAKILIFTDANALNILYVTPGVDTIPAPTIETFETFSFLLISLNLILLLFLSISKVLSLLLLSTTIIL